MHGYPSDISREQFELVREDLENAKRRTRPRQYDLYDIFCAMLYILRGGIQWRMLPANYPRWELVYYYYSVWSKADEQGISLLDRLLKKLVKTVRNDCLKKDKTTLGIVDAKSIKNADTAEEKGYDAGKKVSGIKLHIVVDTLGLPHALYVTRANVTDRKGAEEMIGFNSDSLSAVKNFLVDGGYSGDKFANTIKRIHGATVEVVKRNELHLFKVLPMRWIVERSFGWLEKCRRLWKNCERFLHTSLEMTVLAFVALLLRRF